MPPQQLAPVASAETPVVSALSKTLVEAIDRGEPYEVLFVIVEKMAREFRRFDNQIKVRKVLQSFEEDKDTGQPLKTLFLTIPRPMLRKVALRTVAYELSDPNSPDWEAIYEAPGPGAYFASFSIKDRQGAGLNALEYRSAAAQLEKYRAACATWVGKNLDDNYDQSQLSQSEQEALTLAMKIDNQYLEENEEWTENQHFRKPRFYDKTGGTIKNFAHVIDMLERRGNTDFDHSIFQFSSPCYVGCLKDASESMVKHSPDSSSLRESANVWGAFLSCLAHMEFRPRVCQVPVVKC
ncbi:hypothetical protein F5X96DRAFT_618833 [Biscogniauxia mediterranea]|nr:hypothetical protein F5X96DRAFT_618833 [Biscogniauxia mediterranea]